MCLWMESKFNRWCDCRDVEGINGGGNEIQRSGQNILSGKPSSSIFCSFVGQVSKHLILFLKQNVPFVLVVQFYQ